MIVAGFGFRSAASLQSLEDAFARTDQMSVDAIATAQDKSFAPIFEQFAKNTGLRIIPVEADALEPRVDSGDVLGLAAVAGRTERQLDIADGKRLGGAGADQRQHLDWLDRRPRNRGSSMVSVRRHEPVPVDHCSVDTVFAFSGITAKEHLDRCRICIHPFSLDEIGPLGRSYLKRHL